MLAVDALRSWITFFDPSLLGNTRKWFHVSNNYSFACACFLCERQGWEIQKYGEWLINLFKSISLSTWNCIQMSQIPFYRSLLMLSRYYCFYLLWFNLRAHISLLRWVLVQCFLVLWGVTDLLVDSISHLQANEDATHSQNECCMLRYPDTCTSPMYSYLTDATLILVPDTAPLLLVGNKFNISYL